MKKRGNNWYVYYWDGRKVWENHGPGAEGKQAAEEHDLEIRLQKKRGEFLRPAYASGGPLFQDIAKEYLYARRDLAPTTIRDIWRCLNLYAGPINDIPIQRLTLHDWRRVERPMWENKLNPRTINNYFTYLHGILKWARKEKRLLPADPWIDRRRIRPKKIPHALLTLHDLAALHRAAKPHLQWIIEVAYQTGARVGPSELFSLKWTHMDWDRRRLLIYATKTKSARYQYLSVPFTAAMARRYKTQKTAYPQCPYICHYKGARIKRIKTSWRQALEDAGITKHIRPYDLRHLHITHALAGGAPPMLLAERVGHANTRMIVDFYTHLAADIETHEPFQLPDPFNSAP